MGGSECVWVCVFVCFCVFLLVYVSVSLCLCLSRVGLVCVWVFKSDVVDLLLSVAALLGGGTPAPDPTAAAPEAGKGAQGLDRRSLC